MIDPIYPSCHGLASMHSVLLALSLSSADTVNGGILVSAEAFTRVHWRRCVFLLFQASLSIGLPRFNSSLNRILIIHAELQLRFKSKSKSKSMVDI